MGTPSSLVVIETHPVQYRAPVYRELQQKCAVPVTAIYGSDFSVAGYRDTEFGSTFKWDTDLLSGYTSVFLSRVATGGARTADTTSTQGLGRALRAAAPAAVLLTGYSPRFHQIAAFHALQSRSPVLFRAETADHVRARGGVKERARKAALRWLYGSCRRLLYIGRRSNQHYKDLQCDDDKLVFAPYCVDTTPFRCGEQDRSEQRRATRHQLGIGDDDVAILFSGKLSVRKGPDLLIEAARALQSTTSARIVVVFLGSGEMADAVKQLAGRPPAVCIRLVGFQNQRCLSRYYHTADLLALPSRHSETWGLVVNEALHHGLPCVVSDSVGCTPDLVESGVTGEVSDTGSAASLTAALKRALPLIGHTDVRNRCRDRVSQYTIETAAAGIARAYWASIS
jgi:glycosyltransferase involved in cell wall biosynthesis